MTFDEFANQDYRPQTVLNPKLWDNDSLKPQVRGALINIAEDFKQFCQIDFNIQDIVITGSMANYNYTAKSDLDLHLIVDYNEIDCDREVAELFDTKRHLYKRDHDIRIYGIPVELYVEDQDTPATSNGTYSIKDDKWITKPQKNLSVADLDQERVKELVTMWETIIRSAVETADIKVMRTCLDLLKKFRRQGLKVQGEFGPANLAYKELRNSDQIAALITLINRLHDKGLSIPEYA